MLRCFGTVSIMPPKFPGIAPRRHQDAEPLWHCGIAVPWVSKCSGVAVGRSRGLGDSQHCRKRPIFRGFRVLKAGPRRGRGGQGGRTGWRRGQPPRAGSAGLTKGSCLRRGRTGSALPENQSSRCCESGGSNLQQAHRAAQLDDGDRRAGTDPFEQVGLGRFEFNEAAEHLNDVDQFRRVLGEPVVGLDVAELGRRPRSPMIGRSRFALR